MIFKWLLTLFTYRNSRIFQLKYLLQAYRITRIEFIKLFLGKNTSSHILYPSIRKRVPNVKG